MAFCHVQMDYSLPTISLDFYGASMIYNEDGLERLKTVNAGHIICDPDYVNQPHIDLYKKHCKGNIIVFCDPLLRPPGSEKPSEVLIWLKPVSTKWTTKRCNAFFEEILVFKGKPKPVYNPIHWSSMSGMFTDTFISKPDHPYAKPISMFEKLILMYTNPGDLVFDPFCGSGTTGIACKKHGRRFVGCEIDPKRFQMATLAYANA